MATIKPFKALRPQAQWATQVASKPYDVFLNREEVKSEVVNRPYSYLHITRSDIDCRDDVNIYDESVYEKAKDNLHSFINKHILVRDEKPHYYIYELNMSGRIQTGLVCVSCLEDYRSGIIKKHELTRPEKENDRLNHIKATGAQTGNVFLIYRDNEHLHSLLEDWKANNPPAYHFLTDDNIEHKGWVIDDDAAIITITHLFAHQVSCTYIADGHHRASSAAKISLMFPENNEAEYFLTTIFPASQLQAMSYNRLVKDLNGLDANSLIEKIKENFTVTPSHTAVVPNEAHTFGMYLQGKWYYLQALTGTYKETIPEALDINILQKNILKPLLGIEDQQNDNRIGFTGGNEGLQQRVDSGEMAIAFNLYPLSVEQLLTISDMSEIMPPKSTWFVPKLRDGLFTNVIY